MICHAMKKRREEEIMGSKKFDLILNSIGGVFSFIYKFTDSEKV